MVDPRNVTQVRPHIWVTNLSTGTNYDLLRQLGVNGILCLERMELPAGLDSDDFPFRFAFRPLGATSDSRRAFDEAVETLGKLVRSSSPVLVHCYHGQGRSVAVVARYLAITEERDPRVVLDEVVALRGALGQVSHRYQALALGYNS